VTSGRCADISEAAGEPISATATTAASWLLVEVRGPWPRDVGDDGALDDESRVKVAAWLEEVSGSKLMFIRRPGKVAWERPLAFVVRATETETQVRRLELDDAGGLTGVDLASDGTVVDRQLVLVCGHGTRDVCCALRGRAVLGALAGRVAPDDLWLSSHQGGHRFAANVLVLPSGIQLGRVSPEKAPSIVGEALCGRISLEHYRGRTAYTRREQAAEWVVRESLALVGASGLTLVGDDGTAVRFVDESGSEHRAVPEELAGPAVPASCGAEPEPQRHVTASLA
jgi:hypothetical protein